MVRVDAETVQGDQVVPVALEDQEVPMVQKEQGGVHDGAGPSDDVPGRREPSERNKTKHEKMVMNMNVIPYSKTGSFLIYSHPCPQNHQGTTHFDK